MRLDLDALNTHITLILRLLYECLASVCLPESKICKRPSGTGLRALQPVEALGVGGREDELVLLIGQQRQGEFWSPNDTGARRVNELQLPTGDGGGPTQNQA